MANESEPGGSCRRAWQKVLELEAELEAISAQALDQLAEEEGAIVRRFARNPATALRACRSPNLHTRRIALQVLTEIGATPPGLPEQMAAFVWSDDPEEMRVWACVGLRVCAFHQMAFPYLDALLPVVFDEQSPESVRVHAYNAVRFLRHLHDLQRLIPRGIVPPFLRDVQTLAAIDWDWIRDVGSES